MLACVTAITMMQEKYKKSIDAKHQRRRHSRIHMTTNNSVKSDDSVSKGCKDTLSERLCAN